MKLIADSGSTKTDWRLIDNNNEFHQYSSEGLNPNFTSDEDFVKIIRTVFESELAGRVRQIWFYGAGCSSDENVGRVTTALAFHFENAMIHVHSDMLGAARALCLDQPGMAAILGTGMNTCVYDGHYIVENHFSLGYILGDEGSGAYLGKNFIRHFLSGSLSPHLHAAFVQRYHLEPRQVIEHIYRKPLPNRFLAQFSKFLYQNIADPFAENIVLNSFRDFFRSQILTYEHYHRYPLHLTGSVAFYFSRQLKRVAGEEGIRIGTITEKPISGMAIYHKEYS